MENIIAVPALIGTIILTPVLWSLYHKIFNVTYFGSALSSIIKELSICLFISMMICSFGGALLLKLLSFVGGVLGWILRAIWFLIKWVAILAAAALVIYTIYYLIMKNKKDVKSPIEIIKGSEKNAKEGQAAEAVNESSEVISEVNVASEAPIVQNSLKSKALKCPKCGADMNEGDSFCMKCGARIE